MLLLWSCDINLFISTLKIGYIDLRTSMFDGIINNKPIEIFSYRYYNIITFLFKGHVFPCIGNGTWGGKVELFMQVSNDFINHVYILSLFVDYFCFLAFVIFITDKWHNILFISCFIWNFYWVRCQLIIFIIFINLFHFKILNIINSFIAWLLSFLEEYFILIWLLQYPKYSCIGIIYTK